MGALQHQNGAQLPDVEYTRERAAICSVFALATHADPASRLTSATSDFNSFSKCFKVITEPERSVQFYSNLN